MSESREITKRIEIKERVFIIEKMDAFESVAVLKELLTKALPIDLLSMFGDTASRLMGDVGGEKKDMSIDEFIRLQKRMMKYVSEILPVGETKVIDSNGFYAVNDFEKNLNVVVKLLIESVRFNYESFFIENLQALGLLEEIKEKTSQLQNNL